MSTTLTYGQKIPATGEKGSIWFPILEDNFTRLDAHSHNGTDSVKLTAASVTATTTSISSASWAAVAGKTGLLSQVVSMPTGYVFDSYGIRFRDTAGAALFLQHEKVSSGTYRVYINSSINVTAIYG